MFSGCARAVRAICQRITSYVQTELIYAFVLLACYIAEQLSYRTMVYGPICRGGNGRALARFHRQNFNLGLVSSPTHLQVYSTHSLLSPLIHGHSSPSNVGLHCASDSRPHSWSQNHRNFQISSEYNNRICLYVFVPNQKYA